MGTLLTKATYTILDAIGHGELEGLCDRYGNRLGVSQLGAGVYLDNTLLRSDTDNQPKFNGISVSFQNGSWKQGAITGISSKYLESSVDGLNLPVRTTNTEWETRTIPEGEYTSLKVGLMIHAMYSTNNDGNFVDESAWFRIQLKRSSDLSTQWVDVYNSGAISGVVTDGYMLDAVIILPKKTDNDNGPWDIRVHSDEEVTGNSRRTKTMSWVRVTLVFDTKMTMAGVAYASLEVDSTQVQSLPVRGYQLLGRKVKIPSNYDAWLKKYTGLWDGTFKVNSTVSTYVLRAYFFSNDSTLGEGFYGYIRKRDLAQIELTSVADTTSNSFGCKIVGEFQPTVTEVPIQLKIELGLGKADVALLLDDAIILQASKEVTGSNVEYVVTTTFDVGVTYQLAIQWTHHSSPLSYTPYLKVYWDLGDGFVVIPTSAFYAQCIIDRFWTNNPAWILYDLLTDEQIALGLALQGAQPSKYLLYEVGRFCDELVSTNETVSIFISDWGKFSWTTEKDITRIPSPEYETYDWGDGRGPISNLRYFLWIDGQRLNTWLEAPFEFPVSWANWITDLAKDSDLTSISTTRWVNKTPLVDVVSILQSTATSFPASGFHIRMTAAQTSAKLSLAATYITGGIVSSTTYRVQLDYSRTTGNNSYSTWTFDPSAYTVYNDDAVNRLDTLKFNVKLFTSAEVYDEATKVIDIGSIMSGPLTFEITATANHTHVHVEVERSQVGTVGTTLETLNVFLSKLRICTQTARMRLAANQKYLPANMAIWVICNVDMERVAFQVENTEALTPAKSKQFFWPEITKYEPRYSLGLVVDNKQEALDVITTISGIFMGFMYWANGTILFSYEHPIPAPGYSFVYNQANVIGGEFTYESASVKAHHTSVEVIFNDIADMSRAKPVYVRDPEGIRKYGVRETLITLPGVTSRTQAWRAGKALLISERTESETVSWQVGLDGLKCMPGDVVLVQDPRMTAERIGGRVESYAYDSGTDESTVVLDKAFTFSASTYYLHIMDTNGLLHSFLALSLTEETRALLVTGEVKDLPENAVWVVTIENEVEGQLVKIVNVVEDAASKGTRFKIHGLKYNPNKLAEIEQLVTLQMPPSSNLNSERVASPPASITISPSATTTQVAGVVDVLLRWSRDQSDVVERYEIAWGAFPASDGGVVDYQVVGYTQGDSYKISVPITASYSSIRIVALSPFGNRSSAIFKEVRLNELSEGYTFSPSKHAIARLELEGSEDPYDLVALAQNNSSPETIPLSFFGSTASYNQALGANSEFGSSAKFVWELMSSSEEVNGSELQLDNDRPIVEKQTNPFFSHYELKFFDAKLTVSYAPYLLNQTLPRVEPRLQGRDRDYRFPNPTRSALEERGYCVYRTEVTSPNFEFTRELNSSLRWIDIRFGQPNRALILEVRAVDVFGNRSNRRTIAVYNSRPAGYYISSSGTYMDARIKKAHVSNGQLIVQVDNPTDKDFKYLYVVCAPYSGESIAPKSLFDDYFSAVTTFDDVPDPNNPGRFRFRFLRSETNTLVANVPLAGLRWSGGGYYTNWFCFRFGLADSYTSSPQDINWSTIIT